MPYIGDAVGLIALAVVLAAAWTIWRRPFVGLGVLVAGMALHNFLIMVLLRLGASHVLIRVVQSWKEGIIALLVIAAGLRLRGAYREHRLGRPTALDLVAAGFFSLMVFYLILPSGVLHGHSSFQQRLAAFRIAAYIPVLYAFGRVFQKPTGSDLNLVAWLIVGAGAIVGAFGLYELWFVTTRTWLDWGVNDFSAWLGFQYSGPGHLPENFFQTLPDGLFLRRMVSTYLSPLGIAYTGLLVFPIAVVLVDRQPKRTAVAYAASFALLFLVVGILLTVTRLAMISLLGEGILLALIMRRTWVTVMVPLLAVAVLAVFVVYPQVGPTVDALLIPGGPHRGGIVSAGDPSLQEHLKTIEADFKVALHHPLGLGLGSAGSSANRFGTPATANADYAPGESAILTMFVDTGYLGGAGFLALYLLALLLPARRLWRSRSSGIESALVFSAAVGGLALVPIVLTSDLWGDLSVLFLFWWAAGYSVSWHPTGEQARIAQPSASPELQTGPA